MLYAGKPTILIIDDDLSILHAFTRIFQRKGYTVTVAQAGKEAIEKIASARFDVALVDLTLPDMEGTALFPLIKNSSPQTIRIMLTGKTLGSELVGVDAVLGKPIAPDKLLGFIDSKLKNRDLESP